jgi:hypothetical protein
VNRKRLSLDWHFDPSASCYGTPHPRLRAICGTGSLSVWEIVAYLNDFLWYVALNHDVFARGQATSLLEAQLAAHRAFCLFQQSAELRRSAP